jgi:cellulose synthase/poly-beta-1,6-N-acetylglucosamine synthase-like glycosyltransferase
MGELLLIPTALVYLVVVGLLFVFGINYFYITFLAWHYRERDIKTKPVTDWPHVTVQLPIYNERYVAERLIKTAANIVYPGNLFEIQVLDDSTDETQAIVKKLVYDLQNQGVNIAHLHRSERSGYKAGALANGLLHASGDFIAVFDADFLPTSDFLLRTIPYFQDPQVGFVQARWKHLNRDYSLLTLFQSLILDGHFVVEQFARFQAGYWFNFNGTAGIWRRKTVEDVGGWTADTLTEDLDLSYRAFMKGWRAIYTRDITVPAELPVSFSAYRRQQQRWARGSFECAIKFVPRIWQAHFPLAQKVEATFHLTGNMVYLLVCALSILYPLVLYVSRSYATLIALFGIGVVFNLTTLAPTLFFIVGQQQIDKTWWHYLPIILFTSIFSSGMMLNTMRAAWHVLKHRKNVFERTPKFGIVDRQQEWRGKGYQLNLDPLVFLELAFALFNILTVVYALALGNWVIAIYSSLFAAGLLLTAGMTIWQTVTVARGHTREIQ